MDRKTYGYLTVIGPAPPHITSGGRKMRSVKCECVCGKVLVKTMQELRSGNTKSCGCMKIEMIRTARTTHGKTGAPEWNSWISMRRRCLDPNYKDFHHYGGRGIAIDPSWNDFETFFRDMGPIPTAEHTLDRIDSDGNYEPNNCRWSDVKTQRRNRRSAVLLTWQGKTQTLAGWAEELGVNYFTLHHRHRRGWTVERILTQPIR